MGRWKSILSLLVFVVLLTGTILSPVFAQEAISNLRISAIDSSGFPIIKVQLQAVGPNNTPITDLTPPAVNVSENGQSVQFTMDPVPAGIRVVFVIDAGQGLNSVGGTGQPRISEMKSAIQNYFSQMNASDSVMLLAQEGDKTNVISDFSSSATDLQNSLNGYQYNPTQASSGYAGILTALSRLQQQTDGKEPFIVFLSSGIQNQAPDIYQSVVSQLSGQDHPTIHAILFRAADDGYGAKLLDIAKVGGGTYGIYSSADVANTIYQAMGLWRNQYMITYRSPNSNSGNRQVVITTAANNIPASKTYDIGLQPPQVSIQDPITNTTIIRKPSTTAIGQTSAATGTDVATLKVQIAWPDSHPRKLASISVLVNNQTQGTVANPTVDSSGVVEVPWDLRTYNQLGQNPVSIQVKVTDEVGMTGQSGSVPLIVLVQPDACKSIPNVLCTPVLAVLPYLNFLAVGIALVALVLVVLFRRQIVTVGGSVVEGVSETVTRLTKRRTASTAKAYLKAIAGIDSGRTTFDLYGTTPIGRSRRNAELVFHASDEDSPISRLHCTILEDDNMFSVRDEDSQWGTYLNDKKLEPLAPEELHDGDEIELAQVERGGIRLRFSLGNPSEDHEPSDSESKGDQLDEETIRNTKPARR